MINLISAIFCVMPESIALLIGRWLGRFWYYVLPIRMGVARHNLERCLGPDLSTAQIRAILKRTCENQAMFICEGLRLPAMTAELALKKMGRRPGWHHLEEALARGKGVLFVTAHMGSYELLTGCIALANIPTYVVYRDISMKSGAEFWMRARTGMGLRPLPPRKARAQIVEALEQGSVVILASDQHMPPHRGIVCEFLGQLASTMTATARFALDTGATVVLGHTYRDSEDPTKSTLRIEPVLELECPHESPDQNIRHNTERINQIMEGWIRQHPDQWLWHHRRFKVQDAPDGWDIPGHLEHLIQARSS